MKRKLLIGISILMMSVSLRAATVGKSAPAFTLKDMTERDVVLKESLGSNVVFVNFWASWCPPCLIEFPKLNELAAEYGAKGVRVLAINLDTKKDNIPRFLEKVKGKKDAVIILQDPKGKTAEAYGVEAMPSSFIVDKSGIIRFVHLGFDQKDPAKWRKEIDGLLSGEEKK